MQYPTTEFDISGFGKVKGKLVLVNGRASNGKGSQCRANLVLGEKLGVRLEFVAGEHVGYIGATMGEFARDLLEVLGRK